MGFGIVVEVDFSFGLAAAIDGSPSKCNEGKLETWEYKPLKEAQPPKARVGRNFVTRFFIKSFNI